ncbi:MAG: penicillin-binding protein, partial [bacterium]
LRRCCSPLEMANAYATIASGGWRNKPKAITEVRFPDGKVEDLSKPQRVKAFDSAAMYEVTKILEANIKGGTGTRANIGCPAAGKTGTTENNANAWFVGYTPKLATAVWVGFPKGNIPMGPIFNGGNVDGGTYPAQIWGRYMKLAKRSYCGQFPKPDHPFKVKAFRRKYSQPYRQAAPYDPNIDPVTGKPRQLNAQPGTGSTGGAAPQVLQPVPPPPPPQAGGIDPEAYDPSQNVAPDPNDPGTPDGGATPP